MSRILRNIREQNPLSGVFSRLFPSSFVHRRFRLFIIFLVSQIPLIFVLVAGVHVEGHIHDKDPILTRCSPTEESAWMFFAAVCGLLATVADIYCVDRLTSTPEQRSQRNWPKWSRRSNRTCPSGNPSSSTSCNSIRVDRGEVVSMSSTRAERAGVFREHINEPERDIASHPRIENEPLSPANGFSPDAGPRIPTNPPTYHEAVLMPMQLAQPVTVDISGDVQRPRIVRREAANPLPAQPVAPEPHQGGLPSWSKKPGPFNLLWKLCLSGLFILCIIPLILSCSIQPLVRDSAYFHACDGYEWEVILNARNGLKSTFSNLPTAKFIERKADLDSTAKTFTMEMSLDAAPVLERSAKALAVKPNSLKHRRNTIKALAKDKTSLIRTPRKKEPTYYNRFFHLKYSHKLLTQQLLSLISYNTFTHAYRGTFVSPKSTLAMSGKYTENEHMKFPELGLRQAVGEQEDYFGFPRIVLEKDRGGGWEKVLVTSRVKRRSCTEMKVCVKGVKVTEAAVAVGPLLLEVVEAARKCKEDRRRSVL